MKTIRKIRKTILKNWQEIMLGGFVVLFFIATSSFSFLIHDYSSDLSKQSDFVKWVSPDETANYIFAKLYAQTGEIQLQENYNLLVDDIMRPRSLRSDHGAIKPVSFLGIILIYGQIASIFGYKIIPFLTPFFASIGIVFFYLFVRKLFGRHNAFLSAMFLVFFPPFFYYTTRSMFHNVLFTVLLIISLYFSLLMGEKGNPFKRIENLFKLKYFKKYIFSALAGTFLGLTIVTRVSELLWLLPLFLFLWLFNMRRVGITKFLIFLSFLIIATLPMFYYNQLLYGSFFAGGYPQMNQSIQVLATASTDIVGSSVGGGWLFLKDKLEIIKNTIFHFGFDWEQSKLMFQNYFIDMFAWIFWSAIVGLVLFFANFKNKKYGQWLYLPAYFLISFILLVYYGSWVFHDNPDLEAITIGNSYTRYWLPVYLGALPFASIFVMRLTKIFCLFSRGKLKDEENDNEDAVEKEQVSLFEPRGEKTFCRNFLRVVIIFVIAFVSLKFVLYGSEEGLAYTFKKVQDSRTEWEQVIALTENNSAIVTRYHDKLFFPERKVIVGLFDDKNMNDRYGKLAKELPLYYYNFSLKDADIKYLNNRRLAESGLHIELVKKITDDFSLYRLTSSN
jgi:hypothetical protein